MRFRAGLFFAGMMLSVAGCASDGDSATTSVDEGTTTTVAETTTTSMSELALSDLTGNWDNSTLLLMVTDQGEYSIAAVGTVDPDQALMWGFVARNGLQFNFITGTQRECPGQTGVYEATINDDMLTLTLVDDPCELRAEGFEDVFSKTPG